MTSSPKIGPLRDRARPYSPPRHGDIPADAGEPALAELNENLKGSPRLPGPAPRPRDAAAIILVDYTGAEPKILVGRRNPKLRFIPGKFVFPGGALDSGDRQVATSRDLPPEMMRKLQHCAYRASSARLRGLAIAAIRELAEETGLQLGERTATCSPPAWPGFAEGGIALRLDGMRFVARAITPPGMIRRFDTRFFAADAHDVAAELPGVVGPDAELVELRWTTLDGARDLDLHVMTRAIVSELAGGLQTGFESDMRVPFFRVRHGRFIRDYID